MYHYRTKILLLLVPTMLEGMLMKPSAFIGGMIRTLGDSITTTTRRPSSTVAHGSINELYSSEPPDPERRKLRLAFLSASRPKRQMKTEKETNLDKQVWGRWKLVVSLLFGAQSSAAAPALIHVLYVCMYVCVSLSLLCARALVCLGRCNNRRRALIDQVLKI